MSRRERYQKGAPVDDDEQTVDGELIEDAEVRVVRSRPPVALGLLLLIVLLGGGLLGYRYIQQMQGSLQQMNQSIAQASQRQDQLNGLLQATRAEFSKQDQVLQQQKQALVEQQSKLEAERDRLKQESAEMRQALQSVHQRIGRSSSDWIAAEAGYLMQVANYRLLLERDLQTAIRALQSADARLRDTGDPSWIGVREIIAAEIAQLKGVAAIDLAGLSARLTGLARQVGSLKIVGVQTIPDEERPSGAADSADKGESERSLDTLLEDGWKGFKSVMTIRYHGQPVQAMLPPEQHYFVYQNLRLQLEAARLGLLRGDQLLFDSSLQTAGEWIRQMFDPEQAATSAMLQAIKELQQVQLRPQLPDISSSLKALRERLQQRDAQGTNG